MAKTSAKKKTPAKAKTVSAKKPAAKKVIKKVVTTKKPVAKKPAVKKSVVSKKIMAAKKTTSKPVRKVAKPSKVKSVLKSKPATKRAAPKRAAKPTQPNFAKKKAPEFKTQQTRKTSAQNIDVMKLLGMENIMQQQPNFQFDKMAKEAANASRESVEAFIQSSTIFAKRFETILKTAASMTQSAAEKQAQFAKQMMSSKTLNEMAETQSKITKASFDEFVADATKLSEMSVKMMNESAAPLNEQMTKGMQKAGKMAA